MSSNGSLPPDERVLQSSIERSVAGDIRGRTRLLWIFVVLMLLPLAAIVFAIASPSEVSLVVGKVKQMAERALGEGEKAREEARKAKEESERALVVGEKAREDAQKAQVYANGLASRTEAVEGDLEQVQARAEENERTTDDLEKQLEILARNMPSADRVAAMAQMLEDLGERVGSLEEQLGSPAPRPKRVDEYRAVTIAEGGDAQVEDFRILLEVGSHRSGSLDRLRVAKYESPDALFDGKVEVGQATVVSVDDYCLKIVPTNVIPRFLWARDYVQFDVVKTSCPRLP